MSENGKLIVFEGPDGVGKTTLVSGVVTRLRHRGIPCGVFSFPGREPGTLGEHIYTLHHHYHDQYQIASIDPASLQTLHVAAHIDAIARCIRPALAAGHHVVLDRFWWSTWVYGAYAGIPTDILDALVELEDVCWADIHPAAVFLIRADKPWRPNEVPERFLALRRLYDAVAECEAKRSQVYTIHNCGTLEEKIGEIIAKLEPFLRDGETPSRGAGHSGHRNRRTHTHDGHRSQQAAVLSAHEKQLTFFSIAPAVPTEVFDTYWRFAAERQQIFFRRCEGAPQPWTTDPILATFKFTNAYRAADRVSQYLIREVIYQGDQSPDEVFFRVLVFKVFNRVETWELLKQAVGEISYAGYSFERYATILEGAMSAGRSIFSAAYMMPTGGHTFGDPVKHRNYLRLIETMLADEVPQRLAEVPRMRQAFDLLRSYPMIGDFLAYQYVTDLNYSEVTDFSEMEFTVPGPGARSGIRKCFRTTGGMSEADIILMMAERQDVEFARLGLEFRSLWGRPLQLIDCQNLFCEVDKYARVAHPEAEGVGDRKRIKQHFRPCLDPVVYWFPPKWNLNVRVAEG